MMKDVIILKIRQVDGDSYVGSGAAIPASDCRQLAQCLRLVF
jgi:hypothetical protein